MYLATTCTWGITWHGKVTISKYIDNEETTTLLKGLEIQVGRESKSRTALLDTSLVDSKFEENTTPVHI